MKQFYIPTLLLILFFLSCSDKKNKKDFLNQTTSYYPADTTFGVKPESILKDFNSWWAYDYQHTNLSGDFVGLNENLDTLEREAFLKLLSSGKFAPLKTMLKGGVSCYQLHTLSGRDPNIGNTIIQQANRLLLNFQRKGKPAPAFAFKDLNGNIYNAANTRGKIVVLKCWFIHCGACVAEFPELNKMVAQYRERKDILFISLAMDSKEDLEVFLKTRAFDYAVVPDQRNFMINELKASSFPTHIIIDKKGKLGSVVWRWEDLARELHKEAKGS